MQVSTSEPDARGARIGLRAPGKISLRSIAYNHDLKTIKRFDDSTCSQRTSWQTWFGQNCWKLCFWQKGYTEKVGL